MAEPYSMTVALRLGWWLTRHSRIQELVMVNFW
jgi:hypothetical protein